MVAYSFQQQFAAPIKAGAKRQTIRADRRRHARSGETLQLYTGMRTRQCRLIGRAVCVGVGPVRLYLRDGAVALWTGVTLTAPSDLDAFAIRDGFPGWTALAAFWASVHPTTPIFSGVQIEWGSTFELPILESPQ
jgi:hypothetical protein